MPGYHTLSQPGVCQPHRITTQPAKYDGQISWEVSDFQETIQTLKKMESPPIKFTAGQSELQFQLKIELESGISVYFVSLNERTLKVAVALRALTGTGDELASIACTEEVFDAAKKIKGFRSFLSNIFPLTIEFVCNFTVTVFEEVSGPVLGTGVEIVRANTKLLNTGLHSDITIACDGEHFKCHKAVLASRLKYFESMFNMAEQGQSSIVLKDIGAHAFALLLEFIYTGSLSDSSDLESTELLILADQFLFNELKLACEVAISKTIDLSNAVELLSIAHTYSAKYLQQAAGRFVMTNRQQLSKTEEWNEMVKTNPGAMGALFKE